MVQYSTKYKYKYNTDGQFATGKNLLITWLAFLKAMGSLPIRKHCRRRVLDLVVARQRPFRNVLLSAFGAAVGTLTVWAVAVLMVPKMTPAFERSIANSAHKSSRHGSRGCSIDYFRRWGAVRLGRLRRDRRLGGTDVCAGPRNFAGKGDVLDDFIDDLLRKVFNEVTKVVDRVNLGSRS